MTTASVCDMELPDFIIEMEEFHGGRSPGMLVGAFLLDAALKRLGDPKELVVMAETINCLPDAVQILTPCTVGNGMLQVFTWGKFAITAFDKASKKGVRAWLVAQAVPGRPVVNQWFNRPDPEKGMPPFDELAADFLGGLDDLIDTTEVTMAEKSLVDYHPKTTGICPDCQESYPTSFGEKCPACQGQAYYCVSGQG